MSSRLEAVPDRADPPTATGVGARAEAPSPGASPAAAAHRTREGQALMVAGGMLLGTIGIFVEEAKQDPATTVWFRCVFGLVALLAWGAARGRLRELTGLRGRALAA